MDEEGERGGRERERGGRKRREVEREEDGGRGGRKEREVERENHDNKQKLHTTHIIHHVISINTHCMGEKQHHKVGNWLDNTKFGVSQ